MKTTKKTYYLNLLIKVTALLIIGYILNIYFFDNWDRIKHFIFSLF